MMHSRTLGRALVALALLCAVSIPAGAALPRQGGLTARLDADAFFGLAESPMVTVTLANTGNADLYLVRWQTPLAGLDADLFAVTRDGEPVEYTGRLVKFARPTAGDYIRIPAGGELSARVDLAAAYDFTKRGEYTVQYRVDLQDALRDATPAKIGALTELVSNRAIMAVERDDRAVDFLKGLQPIQGKAGSTSFSGCSSGDQSALNTARGNATTYSSGAKSYLDGHTATTAGPRYTTWFGTPTTSLYNTVSDHFDAELGAFQNAAITFDCGTCRTDPNYNNYYAYVYSTQPYTIYLCGAFWSAGATGTDSKAGTLVHEMSHFNVVAGTNDNAYGQTACKKLAQKNPRKAVDNADSHEYFAENNPALN
ncbi:MAG TPA: M35 family metallo-endopeptidase [Thermoanaerobaculia bacterium]|jgi:peptidyl-Lys metalloendopeptidase|nr:M35 family metallo-endopeptidase [Thermoanaerobaculia bacterium]